MLDPLFPVEEVRQATAGRAPLTDEPRHGHVWPVSALCGFLEEQPTIAVELAFYPLGDVAELLTNESWTHYREALGLAPFAGPRSLSGVPDGHWQVEFGPHTLLTNPSRRFQMVIPRPDGEWEEAVRANGSCAVILGSGMGADGETGAFGIPATAAAFTAAYAGSWAVPELSDIPGLQVVPVNSFRPYDPLRPVTYVLDADVLIAMQRLCFAPERLGDTAEAVRHLTANLLGRDVLPGPALGQLYQPARTKVEPRAALEALAAFDLLMSLSRAEVMDEHRPPAAFDAAYQREVAGAGELPQMLWMYAGVLRLRRLWNPSQTLPERAQSFEAFMGWLRDDLRLNAALLVQVAFNLWISDDEAQRQASRLLRFRAGEVTDATLGELWGTACDLFLVSGQVDAMQVPDVVDAVILTFDLGLAGMRDFFEHIGVTEVATAPDIDGEYVANARVKMDLHPRLEHMRPRVATLAAALHSDMFSRLAKGDTAAFDMERLLALVEGEEYLLTASP
ncbi:MAG: hypothetical protein ACRDLF_00365 [Solirubrobacteraceae bacterium]